MDNKISWFSPQPQNDKVSLLTTSWPNDELVDDEVSCKIMVNLKMIFFVLRPT